ncbi:hypothetical protein [Actinomycetospora flava]|uniref:Uncharacterized protein n=1 Tax=Actinomycetospora flava TaxID=3129232 RepID=A0ABU8MF71_9PSEU
MSTDRHPDSSVPSKPEATTMIRFPHSPGAHAFLFGGFALMLSLFYLPYFLGALALGYLHLHYRPWSAGLLAALPIGAVLAVLGAQYDSTVTVFTVIPGALGFFLGHLLPEIEPLRRSLRR